MAARSLLVGSLELRPDGILHAIVDFEDAPTPEHVSEYLQARRELCGDQTPPVILQMIKTPYADRSVRQLLMKEMSPPPCRAVVTIDSAFVTIFRTYQLAEDPVVPTEVCSTAEAAVEWIEAQTATGQVL
jgi:hypothetical protein